MQVLRSGCYTVLVVGVGQTPKARQRSIRCRRRRNAVSVQERTLAHRNGECIYVRFPSHALVHREVSREVHEFMDIA